MKFADLKPVVCDPATDGSRHVYFECPCGGDHSAAVRVGGPNGWTITAGSLDDLTTLSLTPSIKVSGRGGVECWHGYLTNGEMRPC